MTEQGKTYSASEFIEKLKKDDFGSTSLVYMGMVKAAEDNQHLMFANNLDCSNWVAIPTDIIENIEFVRLVPCKDHQHPLVRMTIKEPSSEEAKMFAALSRSVSPSIVPMAGMRSQVRDFPRFSRDRFPRRDFLVRPPIGSEPPACWDRCMLDILSIGIQYPDHFDFWYDLAIQLCDQVCP
jgi:hypothetical protein